MIPKLTLPRMSDPLVVARKPAKVDEEPLIIYRHAPVAMKAKAVVCECTAIQEIILDPATVCDSYTTNLKNALEARGIVLSSFVVSTSSELPAGLNLNPTTGVLSGTPTEGKMNFFSVQVI